VISKEGATAIVKHFVGSLRFEPLEARGVEVKSEGTEMLARVRTSRSLLLSSRRGSTRACGRESRGVVAGLNEIAATGEVRT